MVYLIEASASFLERMNDIRSKNKNVTYTYDDLTGVYKVDAGEALEDQYTLIYFLSIAITEELLIDTVKEYSKDKDWNADFEKVLLARALETVRNSKYYRNVNYLRVTELLKEQAIFNVESFKVFIMKPFKKEFVEMIKHMEIMEGASVEMVTEESFKEPSKAFEGENPTENETEYIDAYENNQSERMAKLLRESPRYDKRVKKVTLELLSDEASELYLEDKDGKRIAHMTERYFEELIVGGEINDYSEQLDYMSPDYKDYRQIEKTYFLLSMVLLIYEIEGIQLDVKKSVPKSLISIWIELIEKIYHKTIELRIEN